MCPRTRLPHCGHLVSCGATQRLAALRVRKRILEVFLFGTPMIFSFSFSNLVRLEHPKHSELRARLRSRFPSQSGDLDIRNARPSRTVGAKEGPGGYPPELLASSRWSRAPVWPFRRENPARSMGNGSGAGSSRTQPRVREKADRSLGGYFSQPEQTWSSLHFGVAELPGHSGRGYRLFPYPRGGLRLRGSAANELS